MKRILLLLAALMIPASAVAQIGAYESITVSTTAIGLTASTLTSNNGTPMAVCRGIVETAGIRARWDGGVATAAEGFPFSSGEEIIVEGAVALRNLSMIRSGGSDATVKFNCSTRENVVTRGGGGGGGSASTLTDIEDGEGDSIMSGANNAANVVCVSGCSGTAFADDGDFVVGSTGISIVGGLYDTTPTNCTDGDSCAALISQDRRVLVDAQIVGADTAVPVDATGQGDVPITLDSEVVAADVTGQGDVPITLAGETVTLADVQDGLGDSIMDPANDAMNVTVVSGPAGGTSATDDGAYTPGSGSGTPIQGIQTTDEIDAGDVGTVGMTTDRRLLTESRTSEIVIDAMDSATGWAACATTSTGNVDSNTESVEGTASLSFDKVDDANDTAYACVEKTLASIDLTTIGPGARLGLRFVNIPSLTNVTSYEIWLGTSAANNMLWRFSTGNMVANTWFEETWPLGATTQTPQGTGWDPSDLDYIQIRVNFSDEADTLAEILFDAVIVVTQLRTDVSGNTLANIQTTNESISNDMSSLVSSLASAAEHDLTSPDTGSMMFGDAETFVDGTSMGSVVSGDGDAARWKMTQEGAGIVTVVNEDGSRALLQEEDAAHTSGHNGPMMLAVRNDTPDSLAGTTNDYAPIGLSQNGAVWTTTIDPCSFLAKSYASVDVVTATTTEIIDASASNYAYICSAFLFSAGANNVALVEDATNACADPDAGMSGGTTAAEGWNLAANQGYTFGNGASAIFKSASTNVNVCLITSAAVQLSGTVSYVNAP